MDFDYTFTGKLSEDCASLHLDFAFQLSRLLLPLRDEPLEINIKKFYKQRSIAQNRYIWGVMIPTVRAWTKECTGSCPSAEALYAFFRIKIIGDEVTFEEVGGMDVMVISGKRFSQCSTIEFAERVDKIIDYYAEKDLQIPLPKPGTNNLTTDFVDNNKNTYKELQDE